MRVRLRVPLSALCSILPLFLLAPAQARGEGIVIEQDFDGGSLLLAETRVEGDTVHLEGRDNHNPGGWKWIHFSMSGVEGRSLRFQIGNHFATGASRLDELRFVYSHDEVRWRFFDHCEHDREAGLYRFHNREPFAADRVWVAFSVRLTEYEPEMRFRASGHGDEEAFRAAGRSSWFAARRLGARHAMIPETMFRPGENAARYRRMGRHFGLALYAELVEGRRVPETVPKATEKAVPKAAAGAPE